MLLDPDLRQKLRELSRKYRWEDRFEGRRPSSPPLSPRPESISSEDEIVDQPQVQRRFKQSKALFTAQAFEKFNTEVFNHRLPSDLPISWSKRLTTTAGITRMHEQTGACRIELSDKVILSQDRLESTLLHELCHAAAFLIDKQTTPPHGPAFRKWADLAEKVLQIEVSTCHSYDIHTPHEFECTNPDCGTSYGRHSKKGLDTVRFVCGKCRSKLKYSGKFGVDGKVDYLLHSNALICL